MKFRKIKVGAFTLLEGLVTILVMASSLLVLDGLSRYLFQEMQYQSVNLEKDWLIFSEQLRQELDQSQFVKVENDRLFVTKSGQELAFSAYQAGDFRKTNWHGQGYQPMLREVKAADISQVNQLIQIDFVFHNGMERSFVYAVSETG